VVFIIKYIFRFIAKVFILSPFSPETRCLKFPTKVTLLKKAGLMAFSLPSLTVEIESAS